jgi:hypothetical protein
MDETLLDLASPTESKPLHSFDNAISHDPFTPRRANATLVVLARNTDIDGVVWSVEQLEAKFNRKFNYPWVFLNDEPFSYQFKRYTVSLLCSAVGLLCIFRRVEVLTNANVSFGLIPRETWVQPPWIDEERARKGRNTLTREGVIHGGKLIDQIVFNILPLTSQTVFRAYLRTTHSGLASFLTISYRNMCRFNSGVGAPCCGFRGMLTSLCSSFSTMSS